MIASVISLEKFETGQENIDKDLEDALHNLQVEDREVRRRKRSRNTEHLT